MARQVRPEIPNATNAPQYKVSQADWSAFEKLGDAQIKAANENYKLYAQALMNTESAKAYEQFKNDPINLSNALAKLPEMISDLPEEIQTEINKKFYLNSVSLVQRAEKNRVTETDLQNKENSAYIINTSKEELVPAYMNVLQNNNAPADEKKPVVNDIYLQHVDNLSTMADLKNSNGQDVYSATQKKAIKNIADAQLEAFKQYVDGMILNDNDDLETTKKYYQEQVLAPERFMADNYMDRQTYEKSRAYLEKQMKQAGADIKKMRFKQSVKDYTDLQISDLSGKLEALRKTGLISSRLIDNMEKVNVKFNEIDPSKPESPVAMLNLLQILGEQRYKPAAITEEEQEQILELGTQTLDAIADYGKTYGLKQSTVDKMRESVVLMETESAYQPVLQNFVNVVDNFESKMQTVRRKMRGESWWKNPTMIDGMDVKEEEKLIRLNNLLTQTIYLSNEAIRKGDQQTLQKAQRDFQVGAAKIYYDMIGWDELESNPNAVFQINGQFVRPVSIDKNGEPTFDKIN